MAEVHIQNLNTKFDEVHAVKDVNLCHCTLVFRCYPLTEPVTLAT